MGLLGPLYFTLNLSEHYILPNLLHDNILECDLYLLPEILVPQTIPISNKFELLAKRVKMLHTVAKTLRGLHFGIPYVYPAPVL